MDSCNIRVPVVATFLSILAACTSDSPLTPLERAFRLDAETAVDFSSVAGVPASPAPTVRVKDADGDPVVGVEVDFLVTAGGGSVNRSVVMTDAAGRASTVWTLGTTAPSINTLKVSVGTLAPAVFTAKSVAGPPAAMERASADNQSGAAGSVAVSPPTVRVLDSFRNRVAGVSVSFVVVLGGGTVTPVTSTTDSAGLASVSWTFGPIEGLQSVQARLSGMAVTFGAESFRCQDSNCPAASGELVFVSSADGRIYRMNLDGTGTTPLTTGNRPVWSPDGNRIAFLRSAGGPTNDIFFMNADGSNLVRRTTAATYYSVSWSPDGRRLAAEAPTGGDSTNIYTMNADDDGVAPKLLVTNGGSPSWSPDGKTIAYAHGTGYYENSQIYTVNVDGTGSRIATADIAGWNWYPRWSPDGKKLAFTRCDAICRVYALDVAASTVIPLTSNTNSQETAWSPDGKWLAHTIYGIGPPLVGYVPASGGNSRSVISNAYSPSWRPQIP